MENDLQYTEYKMHLFFKFNTCLLFIVCKIETIWAMAVKSEACWSHIFV